MTGITLFAIALAALLLAVAIWVLAARTACLTAVACVWLVSFVALAIWGGDSTLAYVAIGVLAALGATLFGALTSSTK